MYFKVILYYRFTLGFLGVTQTAEVDSFVALFLLFPPSDPSIKSILTKNINYYLKILIKSQPFLIK